MKKIAIITGTILSPIILFAWGSVTLSPLHKSTHESITDYVYANKNLNEYPDISRFKKNVTKGTCFESHPAPYLDKNVTYKEIWHTENPIEYWIDVVDSETKLLHDDCAIELYKKKKFMESYNAIGKALHLDQDVAVPAHNRYIHHNWYATYDDIEYNSNGVAFVIETSLIAEPTVKTCRRNSPNETAEIRFWLTDAEDDDEANQEVNYNTPDDIPDGSYSRVKDCSESSRWIDIPNNTSWGSYGPPPKDRFGLGSYYTERVPGKGGFNNFNEYKNTLNDTESDFLDSYVYTLLHQSVERTYEKMKVYSEMMPVIVEINPIPKIIFSKNDLTHFPQLHVDVLENRNAELNVLKAMLSRDASDATLSSKKTDALLDGRKYTLNNENDESKLPFGEKITLFLEGAKDLNGEYLLDVNAIDIDDNKSSDSKYLYIDVFAPEITFELKEI